MANSSITPIACTNLGSSFTNFSCCYPNDQNNSICDKLFLPPGNLFQNGCPSGDCAAGCSDVTQIYTSQLQANLTGNGALPIARYMACANLPSIASYVNHKVLSKNITQSVQPWIDLNTSDSSLESVTLAVTDCLSSTCERSRNATLCYDYCSPVKLLRNSTSPNLENINACLDQMCSHPIRSLPWADADVIGIGVFSSYVMQCIFIVLLWIGFLGFAIHRHVRKKPERPSDAFKPGRHYQSWIDLLLDFHKSQCYFGATLMIASLTYGIYDVDMLVTFLLTPLTTNSIAPVIFAYLLLVYYRPPSIGTTLLTVVVYILSTLVYWSLYKHLIPLSSDHDGFNEFAVYQQFMFKLSAIPACGGFSGLSVCPNISIGSNFVKSAKDRISDLTPLIWAYSTLVLISLLAYQLYQTRSKQTLDMTTPVWRRAYWLSTVIFLAAIGMQLNVLSISLDLNMINPLDWSFGQIVAVTVWIPPLLEYIYREMTE
ncbi:hypothetical protein F5884DRAFT_550256 [Xylogone sp. PMI_703]|nr:hypothetical protein F5884DRAFT_550256 [Xylogone sp. PMI_703]